MAVPSFTEEELQNLDKQTLIKLFLTTSLSSQQIIEQQTKQIELMNNNIKTLTAQLDVFKKYLFGRRTETGMTDAGTNQYSFKVNALNELEVTIDESTDHNEPEIEKIVPKAYTRKKPKGKRASDLSDIEKVRIDDELSEEELMKIFPDGKWKAFESYTYSRLHYIPASFKVYEHHVMAYKGTGNKIVKAPQKEPGLLRNSVATPSIVAAIMNYKFVNAVPIHRAQQELERMDVFLSSQDMCYWVNKCADLYITRLYNVLKKKLFGYHVIHADETPVEVRKDGRSAGAKSYMWVYRSGALEEHPFVLYEYDKTRKTDHPRAFLKDYHGTVVTDGLADYHLLDKERDDLTFAGCWIHIRRGFAEDVENLRKQQKKAKDGSAPSVEESNSYKALLMIDTMAKYEREFASLTPEERVKARQKKTAPMVDVFFTWLKTASEQTLPKSLSGKAIQYALNEEKYLRVFLSDGYVPMDNNAAERGIRSFTIGRKNWYLIDTIHGAKSSAILYSIAETAKVNHLKPYEYFKYLLEEIPKHGALENDSFIEDLLPWSEKLPDYIRKNDPPKPQPSKK